MDLSSRSHQGKVKYITLHHDELHISTLHGEFKPGSTNGTSFAHIRLTAKGKVILKFKSYEGKDVNEIGGKQVPDEVQKPEEFKSYWNIRRRKERRLCATLSQSRREE